jgi:hypothetical protein
VSGTRSTRELARRAYHLTRLVARRPGDIRYGRRFVESLDSSRSPLLDAVPWMPFRAGDWLDRNAERDWSAFEYGSGGTTVFLTQRIAALHSVEHDPEWFAQTSAVLEAAGHQHVRYELEEPESGDNPAFASTGPEFAGRNFERYVKAIDAHPDASLDLVIVDGRARVACVRRALPKLREGGYLLLDNSDRDEYREAFELLARFPRLDFAGLTPYLLDPSRSSAWRIGPSRAG